MIKINQEFIIKLGNCQGLIYKFQNEELLFRYENSSFWFKSQKPIENYIKNNLNLIEYLEKDNERM